MPGQVFEVLSSPNNCKHGEDAGDLMRQMRSNSRSNTLPVQSVRVICADGEMNINRLMD